MKKKIQDTPIDIKSVSDIGDLSGYSSHQKVRFTCECCGNETIVELRSFTVLKCRRCKHKETYESFSKERIDEITRKGKSTRLEKYGDENYVNPQKTKKTCMEKYGVGCVFSSDEIKRKIEDTNIKKYGNPHYVNPEKTKQTMNEKYGGSTWSSEVLRKKCDKTLRERYGNNLELIVEKMKKTKQERYNNENYNNLEKHKQTCFEKYGVDSFSKSEYSNRLRCRYLYDGVNFDSSWELYLWIYAKDNGIPIEREPQKFSYIYNGDEHFYFPDFKYNGKLIEIKGEHFIEDDMLINPYDRNQDALYEAKYKCMVDNGVIIISDISFAKEYVDNKYTKDYVKLFKTNLPFPYLNENLNDRSDMGLIHHFHKSIYEASAYGRKSPLESWSDKNIIKKVALNRLKYIGKCRPSDILQGFNVTKISPKVSVFNPKLAIDIINKYIKESVIFDPFSGFSGRLISAFRTNKEYIGQDINETHIRESKEICDYIGYECKLKVQDILKDNNCIFYDTALFTCPPYSNKEVWNDSDANNNYTCDEWIDICLEKYKCNEYIFVVDKTEKYNDFIVEYIKNKSHFGINKEIIIRIAK